MKKYRILNNILHRLPNGNLVVQNEISTTMIENETLANFLLENEKEKKEVINAKEIQENFINEEEAVVTFLLDNKIIIPEEEKQFKINELTVVSDDEVINELLLNNFQEYCEAANIDISKSSIDNLIAEKKETKNRLIICVMSSYNYNKAIQIKERIDEDKDNFLLLSYCYNQSVYFDCLYSKKLMTPCHVCNKGIIDGQAYENQLTYQNILDLVYGMDENFEIKYPLTFKHKLHIAYIINKQMEGLIPENSQLRIYKHLQNFTDIYKLDLYTFDVTKDTSIYWEMCDCYEKI